MARAAPALVVSVVLGLVLLAVDERLWDEGGPGIAGFELAGLGGDSDDVLAEWGPDGRSAARLSLWLDFPFLVAYTAFWALVAGRLWPVAIAAGTFDVLENISLLVVLGGSGGAWPVLGAVFAVAKFACLAVVVGAVLVRLAARFRRVTIALAAAGAVALALNTWLVEWATEPARVEGGRIVELAAGDVHVREDGPEGAPPLVLVHGFACSVRWWDRVLPVLARRFRVIRIDLLGHGDSEKPRDGYSMEDQAGVVAGVIRRLGLRRAPVVGHSLGAAVAVALAERHPEAVTRALLIGTPPDGEDERLPLTAHLPFVPVVGHAIDTLLPERFVRLAIEEGFAPEFDPPDGLEDDTFGRTTYTSLTETADGLAEYWDDRALDDRIADVEVPVSVILGEEERHTERSARLYEAAGARTTVLKDLDHTPQIESPAQTARLIATFARGE